jgi:Zn-dependent alcohol dehydrogenase
LVHKTNPCRVTHHDSQAGGASPMRGIPRFVELLDKGQFDWKSLATTSPRS